VVTIMMNVVTTVSMVTLDALQLNRWARRFMQGPVRTCSYRFPPNLKLPRSFSPRLIRNRSHARSRLRRNPRSPFGAGFPVFFLVVRRHALSVAQAMIGSVILENDSSSAGGRHPTISSSPISICSNSISTSANSVESSPLRARTASLNRYLKYLLNRSRNLCFAGPLKRLADPFVSKPGAPSNF
jgi:hypothetical protein